MAWKKQHRELRKILRAHGYIVKQSRSGGHKHVIDPKTGKRVYTYAGTSKSVHFASNTLHEMVRLELLPKEAYRRIR